MMEGHRYLSQSYFFLYFSSAYVIGVALGSWWVLSLGKILLFSVGLFVLAISWRKFVLARTVAWVGIFLLLGMGRVVVAEPNGDGHHLRVYNEGESVVFVGAVVEEPDVRASSVKLTVAGERLVERGVATESGRESEVAGRVLVTVPRYPEFSYGDRLQITGKLKDPGEFDDFSYRDYLAKFDIYSVCYRPRVELLSGEEGNIFTSGLLNVKHNFKKKIEYVLPEPQASFLSGLLLGEKRGMPDELRDKFNLAGVSHVIVISGFHVSIVAGLLMNLGLSLSLSRRQAFWFSVAGLVVFILLTGVQASAVRAGIMGGMVLLAGYAGRMSDVKNALLLAALTMLTLNPKLLRFDVGFQLSFLATIGIVYFSPYIKKLLRFLPAALKIRDSATMTVSAQITTLPILILNFERLSVVAPLTNILVVPLVPLAMMLGFGASMLAYLSAGLGRIAAGGVWLLLTYLIRVVEWLSAVPFAAVEINELWWGWGVVYYLMLFLIFKLVRRKWKRDF